MAWFLFAFAAVALASLGSRDQLLVARLAARLGKGAGLLAAGLLAACASAAAMAWAGQALADLVPGDARTMLVALALLLAGAELLWPNRERVPAEPTRSLAATFVVLLARQLGDGARFALFALSAAAPAAMLTGAGGALGGGAAVGLGWGAAAQLETVPWRRVRVALGAALLVAAIAIGLSARGLIG